MRSFKKILVCLLLLSILAVGIDKTGRFLYESVRDNVVFSRKEMQETAGTTETLLLGNSLIHWGMDPFIVEEELDTTCFNVGSSAQTITGSYYILKDQLEQNPVKRVFMAISVQLLLRKEDKVEDRLSIWDRLLTPKVKLEYLISQAKPNELESFLFYPCRVKNIFDFATVERNVSYKISEIFKTNRTFPGAKYTYYGKGFETRKQGFDGEADQYLWSFGVWKRSSVKEKNIEYLRKIAKLCREKDIELNLVIFPHSQNFSAMQGNLADMDLYMQQFCEEEGADLYSYNYTAYEGLYEKFTDKYFQDQKHFNKKGSKKFTKLLCSDYIREHEIK